MGEWETKEEKKLKGINEKKIRSGEIDEYLKFLIWVATKLTQNGSEQN